MITGEVFSQLRYTIQGRKHSWRHWSYYYAVCSLKASPPQLKSSNQERQCRSSLPPPQLGCNLEAAPRDCLAHVHFRSFRRLRRNPTRNLEKDDIRENPPKICLFVRLKNIKIKIKIKIRSKSKKKTQECPKLAGRMCPSDPQKKKGLSGFSQCQALPKTK